MPWDKLLRLLGNDHNVIELFQNFKSYLEEGFEESLGSIVQTDFNVLLRAFEYLLQAIPKDNLSVLHEKSQFQLCLKLLMIINGLVAKESLCLICNQSYFPNSNSREEECQIRCSDCSKPSHTTCTGSLFLPPGFYWRCNDCDIGTRQQNKPLYRCVQRLKEAFKVKSEPLVTEGTEDKGDEEADEVGEEEEFICIPHRGYFCDLCHYYTFDSEAFATHVANEESKIQSVQESISTSQSWNCSFKTCIKCGTTFNSWKDLFQHVTTFHSRPLDFPQFGDLEWKFLMSHQGKLKRSCCYCGLQFEKTEQWIAHMKVSIDGGEELNDYFKVENNDDEVDNEVLKCTDCESDQVFKSTDAFKIHQATFHHHRTKRFLCAFCPFDGETVKDLNQHIHLEHEGNFNKCLECDFETWAHSVLRRHINVKHRRKVKSSQKNREKEVGQKNARKQHQQVKDEPEQDQAPQRKYFGNRTPIPMVCRLCGEAAPTTNKLAAHFADCHPFEKPFWCQECNIGYETYYGIQNHNRKDHSEERHLCPVCGYSTHGPQYLKRHFRRKHPNYYEQIHAQQARENQAENKVSADEKMKVALELKGLSDEEISERVKALIQQSPDGVWTCAKCQRRFEGKPKRALYSHIRERHFHMRHFKCKECNFLSYNRAEIQEHKEKHKSDKPIHQCDLCGFICDNSTGLIRHKRGRFCQNQNLQRRKRDRDKMARRMAMAFSATPESTNENKPLLNGENGGAELNQRFNYALQPQQSSSALF